MRARGGAAMWARLVDSDDLATGPATFFSRDLHVDDVTGHDARYKDNQAFQLTGLGYSDTVSTERPAKDLESRHHGNG